MVFRATTKLMHFRQNGNVVEMLLLIKCHKFKRIWNSYINFLNLHMDNFFVAKMAVFYSFSFRGSIRETAVYKNEHRKTFLKINHLSFGPMVLLERILALQGLKIVAFYPIREKLLQACVHFLMKVVSLTWLDYF